MMVLYFFIFLACGQTKEKSGINKSFPNTTKKAANKDTITPTVKDTFLLDTALFRKKSLDLVNNKPTARWPVKTAFPLPGALLPFNRIVAYYGNFYSKGMGVLGQYSTDVMIEKLQREVKAWEKADTLTPVIPAIHYIAVTAQHNPGSDNKYRARMPDDQVQKALRLAEIINGIVFLDVQVGHSILKQELPRLEKFLKLPNVHLGIDPEYSMKNGKVPATSIGTFDAADVNYSAGFLEEMVKKYNLPPKILVVHRFTEGMVTNYRNIVTRPEVQIVIHMDGFGFPAKKINSYRIAVTNQPVQFAGFKLFYKNDKPMMKPVEILKLFPKPIYVQYQ